MHSAIVSQSLNGDEAIIPSAYLSSFPQHYAVETDEAEVTYFDWVIVILGHAMLLFPFPGWLLLYALFDEVTPLTPILGTILSVGSIQPGAYLLADAEQNPGERMKHWIFYSAFVSILSIIGLLFTIGPHFLAFTPTIVFIGFLGTGCWGGRRVPENDHNSSIRRGTPSATMATPSEDVRSSPPPIPLLPMGASKSKRQSKANSLLEAEGIHMLDSDDVEKGMRSRSSSKF